MQKRKRGGTGNAAPFAWMWLLRSERKDHIEQLLTIAGLLYV